MPTSHKAHSILAVLFLTAVFCAGVANLYYSGPALADGLAAIPSPRSPAELREASARVKTLTETHLLGKHRLWAEHARIQASLGKTEMNSFSVIKAPDGRLYRGALFPVKAGNAEKLAIDIKDFAEAAKEGGARVLYLGMPDTVLPGEKSLPQGMPFLDYNIMQNTLLFTMRQEGVPFLDARFAFLVHRFPIENIAPKTAFLLTGEAAFALFTYTVDYLEQQFSLPLDPDGFHRDPANYVFEKHPSFFIGQLGKETGPAFSGADDFTAVSPKFETDYFIEGVDMFGNAFEREGDAATTLLHSDALEHYDDLYSMYPEGYYVQTNAARTRVVNRGNPDGPKALVVHDFYSAQIISHLAPLFSEMHTLSLQENQTLDALEYIQDKEFDLVLISFFPQNLIQPRTRALIGESERADRDRGQ